MTAYETIDRIARESRIPGINTPRGYALLSEVLAEGHASSDVYALFKDDRVRHWYDRDGMRLVPTTNEVK